MSLTKDYSFFSDRLSYRGITREDAEIIVSWRSEPNNFRNFLNPKPITLEEHLTWFDCYLDDLTRYDFMIFSSSGIPIGTCGLSNIEEKSCEISYMIGDTNFRGDGLATEAVNALTNVAFKELSVSHVEAWIVSENEASRHVAKNCGYSDFASVFRIGRTQERKC